ncbi:MAG: metal ABC transporter ATP-binding protein [Kosmotogaceae bacterium]
MSDDKLLEVKNLSYSVGNNIILKNVSFDIYRGNLIGIIGPNGAGKTTLVKAIVGDLEDFEGTVKVNGKTGYLPQRNDFERSFPITVKEIVAMGLYEKRGPLRYFKKEDWKEIERLLSNVGIKHLKNRRIGTLSGGEYQRAMLARALAKHPDLLILDEPEAGIDEMGKASFYNLLDNLKKTKNVSIFMVSHDIGMVFDACDSILCLNKTLHCHKASENVSPEDLTNIFSPDFDLILRGKEHAKREHEL